MSVSDTEGRLRPLIDRLGAIVWEAIPGTRRGEATFTFVSEGTESLLGYPPERWLEDPTFWFELVHPEDRTRVNAEILAASQDKAASEITYRCLTADGRELTVRNIVQPSVNTNGFALTGVLIDITDQRAAELRLLRLLELKEALAAIIEPDRVAAEVAARARSALGAQAAAVFLREGDELVMAGYDGYPGETVDPSCVVPLDRDVPAAEVARTGEAIVLSGAELVERYPGLSNWRKLAGDGQFLALPLQGEGAPLGSLTLRMAADNPSVPADRVLLQVLARACATALQRAEHSRAEQAARRSAEAANAVLDAIITKAPEGFALLDTDLRYVRVNDVCAQMTGLPPEAHIGKRPHEVVPGVPDMGTEQPLRQVLETGEPVLDIEVTGRIHGDLERTWLVSYYPILGADGEIEWIGSFVVDITERKRAEMRSALLADLGRLLEEVVSVEERMTRLVEALVPAAFSFCAISFRGADGALERVALRGAGEPDVSLALVVRGRDLGVLAVGTAGGFGSDEALFAEEVARRAALAVDNARLYEAEQLARDRTATQYALAAALAEALTPADVAAATLAEVVSAVGAENGTVWQVSDDGRYLEAIGWLGFSDEEMAEHVRQPLAARRPVADAIRARRALWFASPDELDRAYPLMAPGLRARDLCSAASIPLLAAGRVVGGMFLSSTRSHAMSEEDLALAGALAAQAGQALERARLYEAERRVSVTLQRSLLPAELPEVDGVEIDLRYLPAAGLEAGGDFYEALHLPDGSILFAVGDVVGRGAPAAAAMGQLRSALRAFGLVGDPPGAILGRLSAFADTIEAAVASTAVVGTLDPVTRRLCYACAGHPWPLLVRPDGTAEYLKEGRGVPLGCVVAPVYQEASVTLPPGSTLMLYTDGLSERRGEDTEAVLERLRASSAAHAQAPLTTLLDELVESAGDVARNDDVALIAVRLTELDPTTRRFTFQSGSEQVPRARAAVRAWLEDVGVRGEVAADLTLACGEAFANAVEHSGSACVDVELSLPADNEVTMLVRDYGTWRPPPAVTDRGRGFGLMRALADECAIDQSDDGTTVLMRHRLPPPAGPPPAVGGPCAVWLERGRAVLEGELDLLSAAAVGDQIAAARVIDLSGVTFLDSTGARMLLSIPGALIVAPPGSVARRMLELSGLVGVLDVRDSS